MNASMHDPDLSQEMWGSVDYHIQTLAKGYILLKVNVHSQKYLKVWGFLAKVGKLAPKKCQN